MTDILIALIALVPSCGWLLDRKRHKQQIRQLKAETNQQEFNLSKDYINEFKENIYQPLYEELQKLREAIEAVNNCSHRDDCPVIDKLHDYSTGKGDHPRRGRTPDRLD